MQCREFECQDRIIAAAARFTNSIAIQKANDNSFYSPPNSNKWSLQKFAHDKPSVLLICKDILVCWEWNNNRSLHLFWIQIENPNEMGLGYWISDKLSRLHWPRLFTFQCASDRSASELDPNNGTRRHMAISVVDILVHSHPCQVIVTHLKITVIARLMGPTWGPSAADRTQVGPMLAP